MERIYHLLKRKIKRFVKQFRIIFLLSGIYVVAGSLFYHKVEQWRWLDSVYFSVVSLTTVGYGDMTPITPAGKIFTIFFLIFGIAILGAFIGSILKSPVAKKALHTYERHIETQLHREQEKNSQ